MNLPHLDAAETIFFQRELEQISQELLDIKYAPMKSMQFVPLDTSVDPGAETWTYSQFEKLGNAQAIVSFSDDFKNVNVKGVQYSQRLQSYGAAYEFSIQELRAAQKAGRQLERMRAEAAKKALDVQLDSILALGDSTYGLKGLLNLSSTSTYTPATKSAGGTAWITAGVQSATSDEILADLNGMVRTVVVDTLETERPTMILLPTAHFELISNVSRSNVSDTTIKNFFLMNNPGITIESWSRTTTAGSGSVTRAVAYDPKLLNVRGLMAVPFEQQAPQLNNMAYKVNCHMRTGGVITPYPKSICYADGI